MQCFKCVHSRIGPTVTMGFAVRSLSAREDGGNISIEVSLLQPVAAPVSVGVDFIPGSAGTDGRP